MSTVKTTMSTLGESQKVRLDETGKETVLQYMKENDIKKFNTALNAILCRIARVGTRQFYLATMISDE